MGATMVLRLESEAESEADLRSVRISELPQKMTEIATFSSKKKRKCRQIDSSFEGKEGRKKQIQRIIVHFEQIAVKF